MTTARDYVIKVMGYRSLSGYLTIVFPIAAVIDAIELIGRKDWGGVAVAAAFILVLGRVAMMSIRTHDAEIVVTNFLRTHHIPWASVGSFDVSTRMGQPIVTVVWPDHTQLKASGTYLSAGRFGISKREYAQEHWISAQLNAELKRRAPDTPGTPRDPAQKTT
jgi:hypothetical protein